MNGDAEAGHDDRRYAATGGTIRARPPVSSRPHLPAGLPTAGAEVIHVQTALQLAAGDAGPSGIELGQYGAIGVLLCAFIGFAYRAWQRETARADRIEAEARAERERLEAQAKADRERLEAENRRLHSDIQEKAIPALLASATALTEVTELLRDQQRDRRYEARQSRRDGEV